MYKDRVTHLVMSLSNQRLCVEQNVSRQFKLSATSWVVDGKSEDLLKAKKVQIDDFQLLKFKIN